MYERKISRIGCIGTGSMAQWFTPYYQREGIKYLLTGRTSELRPEEMIPQVDVVKICVPIDAATCVIEKYGRHIRPGQALIPLIGEMTNTIKAALENTSDGIEVMGVHNLWGPLADSMEGKYVILTKTKRSGKVCEEYERLFHKYGANVVYDTPEKHDLLMFLEQKCTTAFVVAFASMLRKCGNRITPEDIRNHSTLTSVYSFLQMARIHGQPPHTYAEILSAFKGHTELLRRVREEFDRVIELGEIGKTETLEQIMKENTRYLKKNGFLEEMLGLTKEVDVIFSKSKE